MGFKSISGYGWHVAYHGSNPLPLDTAIFNRNTRKANGDRNGRRAINRSSNPTKIPFSESTTSLKIHVSMVTSIKLLWCHSTKTHLFDKQLRVEFIHNSSLNCSWSWLYTRTTKRNFLEKLKRNLPAFYDYIIIHHNFITIDHNDVTIDHDYTGNMINIETLAMNFGTILKVSGLLDSEVSYCNLEQQGDWEVFIVRIYYINNNDDQQQREYGGGLQLCESPPS